MLQHWIWINWTSRNLKRTNSMCSPCYQDPWFMTSLNASTRQPSTATTTLTMKLKSTLKKRVTKPVTMFLLRFLGFALRRWLKKVKRRLQLLTENRATIEDLRNLLRETRRVEPILLIELELSHYQTEVQAGDRIRYKQNNLEKNKKIIFHIYKLIKVTVNSLLRDNCQFLMKHSKF